MNTDAPAGTKQPWFCSLQFIRLPVSDPLFRRVVSIGPITKYGVLRRCKRLGTSYYQLSLDHANEILGSTPLFSAPLYRPRRSSRRQTLPLPPSNLQRPFANAQHSHQIGCICGDVAVYSILRVRRARLRDQYAAGCQEPTAMRPKSACVVCRLVIN